MTHISSNYLANKIRMSRFFGTFLLVEGPNDVKFFRKFVNASTCKVEYGKYKNIVLGALRILDRDRSLNRQKKRYLAIVDRDYDFLFGRQIIKDLIS